MEVEAEPSHSSAVFSFFAIALISSSQVLLAQGADRAGRHVGGSSDPDDFSYPIETRFYDPRLCDALQPVAVPRNTWFATKALRLHSSGLDAHCR